MSDPNETFRIEIHIDRASARRALVVGGVLLVIGAAGAAFAVPITYNDGDKLTAAALNQNFTNLEGRVAALETSNGRATASGKYSIGATYCGFTTNTVGNLSGLSAAGQGYTKAKAACEAVAGCSPSAHVCTPDEIFRSVSTGVSPASGWVMAAANGTGPAPCSGFTSNLAARSGVAWDGSGLVSQECIISVPLLCCN